MIDTDCASEGMEEMEFGDMKKQLKKEIKRMKRRMKTAMTIVYGGDASSDAGPDVYYNDERGYEAVERAAPHGIMKTTMMRG